MPRCQLDQFVEKNTLQLRVGYSSDPIRIGKVTYLQGSKVDWELLTNQDYQLDSPNTREDVDIRSGFGCAFLLDAQGRKTGYVIGQHGSCTDENWTSWYEIETESGKKKKRLAQAVEDPERWPEILEDIIKFHRRTGL